VLRGAAAAVAVPANRRWLSTVRNVDGELAVGPVRSRVRPIV
jgi:hypothetical protein